MVNLNIKFTLVNRLFGTVLLTKNANHDKYGYDDYDIGFDVHSNFSVNAELGRNVITFGVDNSLVHTVNRKKYFLVFCEELMD